MPRAKDASWSAWRLVCHLLATPSAEVKIVSEEGPGAVETLLLENGAQFDKGPDGKLALRLGGHGLRRQEDRLPAAQGSVRVGSALDIGHGRV